MHPDLSHGKWHGFKAVVVELSWIQPLYYLQHIADFPLVIPSELDLLKDSLEDRYLKPNLYSNNSKLQYAHNYFEVFIEILLNLRSNILIKSSKIPILDFNITRIYEVYHITTGSFSN